MKVVCILGTLGSGKTTVLNNILPVWSNERVLVVVNDVGTVNVDMRRIKHVGEVQAMTAGCIGCNDLPAFQKLFLEASSSGIDLLVVEPTGIADGREIVSAVSTQDNCEAYCLTLVDVAHFYRNRALNTLPSQLEVANEILLTWTDAGSEVLNDTLDYVAKHASGRRINRISVDDAGGLQQLALDLLQGSPTDPIIAGPHDHHHDPTNHRVYAYSVAFREGVTFEDLVLAITPYRDVLLRAKGVVEGKEFDFVQGDLVQRGVSEGHEGGNFIASEPLPEVAFSVIKQDQYADHRNKKERMRSSDDIPIKDTLEAIEWQLGQYPSVMGDGILRVDFEADVAYQIAKREGVPAETWNDVLQKYFHMRILAGREIVSGNWDNHPELAYWKRRVGMNLAWHMKNHGSELTSELMEQAMFLSPSVMALDGLREIESLSFVEEMAEERPEIIQEVIEFGREHENLGDVQDVVERCHALAKDNPEWQARWSKLL